MRWKTLVCRRLLDVWLQSADAQTFADAEDRRAYVHGLASVITPPISCRDGFFFFALPARVRHLLCGRDWFEWFGRLVVSSFFFAGWFTYRRAGAWSTGKMLKAVGLQVGGTTRERSSASEPNPEETRGQTMADRAE